MRRSGCDSSIRQSPSDLVTTVEPAGVGALPITLDDAARAGNLPPHQWDPFDRMRVAQHSGSTP